MLLLFLSFSAPEDMAPNRFGCETGQLELFLNTVIECPQPKRNL
jgi:hypothetical protein